jgi:hypothetical protein
LAYLEPVVASAQAVQVLGVGDFESGEVLQRKEFKGENVLGVQGLNQGKCKD